MAGIILSVDIGTSSLKAALIDFDGKLISFNREAYERKAAGESGAWELAFARSLERLHAGGGIPDAICISGNGPTLAPVTKEGETLPPLYWHDNKKILPEGSSSSFFLPHVAWFKKNAPAEYEKTHYFLSPHEWLSHRLGAEALAVLPSSSYEPYFWDEQQCRLFGLNREKFPPFVNMGSVIGKLSPQASSFFGPSSGNCLKSGTPIIAGGTDFITALIGTGTLRPGDVCDRAGSSEGINVCSSSPIERKDLRVLPHAKEGLWNIGRLIPSSGRLFERYRISSGQEGRPYGEHLAELIPSAYKTEIFRDLEFFPNIESSCHLLHSPLDLGRAVLCALGFSVREAAEALSDSGFPISEMKVSGGQAKNPRWNQLKADITGITLMIPEIPDGELAGNAVLSAAALGAASGLEEAADKMIRIQDVYKPHPEASDFWEKRYKLYCEVKKERDEGF